LPVPGNIGARQVKWVISKCRYFIGARTHATVAAFSTGVPTISIAYSKKARGINRDIFGHEIMSGNTACCQEYIVEEILSTGEKGRRY
jgi:polysaccharide pyruvyl transferase WcaK-like protein